MSSDIDMLTFESLGDVILETEFDMEFVIDLEIDDLIFLSEPTTELFNSHIYEENLRPSTSAVSLAHLLLKYWEKIR